MNGHSRRTFLLTVTGSLVGISGCGSNGTGSSTTRNESDTATSTGVSTQSPTHSKTRTSREAESIPNGRWGRRTDGEIASPLAANEETLYVGTALYAGTGKGHAYAFDAGSGDVRWRTDIDSPILAGTTAWNGLVFTGTAEGYLLALDTETGAVRWQFQADDRIVASPNVSGETVYVGSRDRHIYALNAFTGEKQWKAEAGTTHRAGIYTTPAVAGGAVYVGNRDRRVTAFDADTGEQRWKVFVEGSVLADPAVRGDTVYVGAREALHAFDTASGEERWRYDASPGIYSASRIVDDTLYLGIGSDYRGHELSVRAIDLSAGGEERWRVETDGHSAAPTVAGASILFPAGDRLLTLSTADGGRRREVQLNSEIRTKPTVTADSVFVGTKDGVVRSLKRE